MVYKHDNDYDESNPISIENHAKKLIGKTFYDVVKDYVEVDTQIFKETELAYNYENKKRKGGLGQLIEECHFHYACNNDSKPDFDKAGVELKVTPYKINKNKSLSAKERLIITMIDYFSVINEKFEESHLWSKGNLILLVYYLYEKEISNRLNYRINYVKLFSPPNKDIRIIKQDYEKIINKIKAGKAHELSESDTLYLGAAPKAATSKDRRRQPFSDELAKPRAFAYKNSYMTYVLNNYIVPNVTTYETIMKDVVDVNFEDYVVNKIESFSNFSVDELCKVFEVKYKRKPKNLEAMLIYRILGIKGNQAEEFVKANIVIKTIRLNSNNKIKESMSFPTFKFKELVKEDWEDSSFGNYLRETRFLFVVYKFDENQVLRLRGCQFWNVPYRDLNEEVYSVWKKTKQVIVDGLQIINRNGRNYNNFPKASENPVCHVRPHAQNANDTYELPDGRQYPKQCFWLNSNYILSQLNKKFL
ncbi:Sau3AI family type II restriction endonuclease [Sedimentibacter sp. MB31-C6]|uniref:Sau3AI family type II restriction endonuclease n=1 Tax=Sedimentibacter sp. MB31-C6 TaxID=3109366 RepID=UPI002DDD6180|nr:Sau3AI family type II restriction endonuclease [Sedimentibacter sp. MB36-C1]WSI04780.1 Sau3AI family type II restriction endonuclease [Sedimentibacter sp. MB36-C1]